VAEGRHDVEGGGAQRPGKDRDAADQGPLRGDEAGRVGRLAEEDGAAAEIPECAGSAGVYDELPAVRKMALSRPA
jgi:hypothetical protein